MRSTEKKRFFDPKRMALTAILAAVATVLMFFSFNVPLMPPFIKMDFSELPALFAAFALGPLSGVAVCLVKNLVNVLFTSTAGAGELCNFLMGVTLVLPAGLVYKYRKNRVGALLGSLAGALVMAALSVPVNYFISYPAYTLFYGLTVPQILDMYRVIDPNIETLPQALACFNMPFTFIKGLVDAALAIPLYKGLAPVLTRVKV